MWRICRSHRSWACGIILYLCSVGLGSPEKSSSPSDELPAVSTDENVTVSIPSSYRQVKPPPRSHGQGWNQRGTVTGSPQQISSLTISGIAILSELSPLTSYHPLTYLSTEFLPFSTAAHLLHCGPPPPLRSTSSTAVHLLFCDLSPKFTESCGAARQASQGGSCILTAAISVSVA